MNGESTNVITSPFVGREHLLVPSPLEGEVRVRGV